MGVPPLEQNALLYIADARRLFAANRIEVAIRAFDSGPAAIAAAVSRAVDVAETAEFPFVAAVLGGRRLRILATNDRFENDYLVARRDRGIVDVADLRGKRIGTALGTITEFYLQRFLKLNGIAVDQVALVDIPPQDFVKSILGGSVDAIVAWQPFVNRVTSERLTDFTVWPVQNGQRVYGLLVTTDSWLEAHRAAATGFLKSLAAAEDFLEAHPVESRAIVAKALDYEERYLFSVWAKHDFSLTLDSSLVAAMEDEARWLASTRLPRVTLAPDFTSLIYRGSLEAVRPAAVNVLQ